jgi:hypothetical protein
MKTIKTKEELKKALDAGEKNFVITDEKLLKALAVRYWIQNNKTKGALLLAALPAAIAAGSAVAPIVGIIGAGLVIGGVSITVAEIIAIGLIIIALAAVLSGQRIESIDLKESKIKFK